MSETAQLLAEHWGFEPTEELPGGWCSHVYADSTKVLKCPWRGEEQTSGYRAAIAMAGWGGPEVFESDEATGSILMSRVLPGRTLAQAGVLEEEAREIAASLIQGQAGRVDPSGFPTLREYFRLQHSLLDHLLETSESRVFLHGDLHHYNILQSDGPMPWVLIDPKGLSGDPAYEPIAFLRNLTERFPTVPELLPLINDRLDFFSGRLGFDRWRMAAWGLIDQLDSGEDRSLTLVEVYEEIVAMK
ncbi:MAG: phosphotransferase [Chlorobia bacterium]|nr:phosphotransferase [Fimbriimonadaceae bacterium]